MPSPFSRLPSSDVGFVKRLVAISTALRIPGTLLVMFLLRDWIFNWLVDPAELTVFVISVCGTPVARAALFVALACTLATICAGARLLSPLRSYWTASLAFGAMAILMFQFTGTPAQLAIPAVLVFSTNLVPDSVFDRLFPSPRLRGAFMAVAVGIAELFLFRHYIAWVVRLWTGRPFTFANGFALALPAILLASALVSVLIESHHLVRVEQALRMPSSARIIARGDFNWVEMDATKQHLFVAEREVPRILRYDAVDFSREPISSVDTDGAQDFAYDPVASELYVYNRQTRQLLGLDADTLQLKRSIPIANLSTGDTWNALDRRTNTITIASEADDEDGVPFVVLDLATGAQRDSRDLDPGYMLLVAKTSKLYLSFFRRSSRLISYDLRTLSVIAEVPAPSHVDRIAFLEQTNEVLLVDPTRSRIARFDADTLEAKGYIDAMFGVRAIAIDRPRNLLFCGSLVNGEIVVMDLVTFKILWRAYLGPWLRTIEVDTARSVAYVSSTTALFALQYGHLQ